MRELKFRAKRLDTKQGRFLQNKINSIAMELEMKHLDFENNGKVRLTRLPQWD